MQIFVKWCICNFNQCYPDKSTKFSAIPQISSKTGKQWRNKGSTELYCLLLAVDAISFTMHIVLLSEK